MVKVVSFDVVPYAQEGIDERLKNWARWVRPRPRSWVHPMWRGFKASEVWTGHATSVPINQLDAMAVEKAVSALPEAHRFVIRWCYVYGGQPRKAAQQVGESIEGLAALVTVARTMLINRRI